jgi:hypothetical protein
MFLLIDGTRELETDSKKTLLEAVKAHVRAGRPCFIEIGFAAPHPDMPTVGPDESNKLRDLEKEQPRKVRKVRTDKGKRRVRHG